METLTFKKENNFYVCEFIANSDFNLHIEKNDSEIKMYVKTVETANYDRIRDLNILENDNVVDLDFVGSIFPKYIKIESKANPTLAVVTFNE